MGTKKDEFKATLESRISDHLQTKFQLKKYADDPEDPLKFVVNGTIIRHNAPANVEVTVKKEGIEPFYWSIKDENIILSSRFLGNITLSKDVCVSDPCYPRGVWCMTQLHNIMPGIWDVSAAIDTIDSWGERTYMLELQHNGLSADQEKALNWVETETLGVDSGTMSVFDDMYYCRKDGSAEDFESDEALREQFHENCFSLSYDHAGLYHADNKAVGVVCSSGIGDGAYPLEIAELDSQIVAMRISFM